MPAFLGECRLPDGNWAVVKHLDRHDLAGLSQALPDWVESITEGA